MRARAGSGVLHREEAVRRPRSPAPSGGSEATRGPGDTDQESAMNVLLFGATGMIGQGVLRECLLDADVEHVVTIGRSATGLQHPKLREIVHKDLSDYSSIEQQLRGFDACFFCLGV